MKFKAVVIMDVDPKENILPLVEEMWEETLAEYISDAIYDIDGVKVKGIKVERKR